MAQKKPTISEYEKERTREVKIGSYTARVRKVPPTPESIKALGKFRTKRVIIGHLAINPPEIEKDVRLLKAQILREMALMHPKDRQLFTEKPIDFVKDKGRRRQWDVMCTRCGDKVGYLWATDMTFSDWCDLHYVCWYDKESWHGAMAVNVSPIDGHLGFECACGEDTRDWRANRNAPPIQRQLQTEYSLKHREFGKPTSKFIAMLT